MLQAELHSYDAAGRLIWSTQTNGRSSAYTYDNNSNIQSIATYAPGTDSDADGLPDYFEIHYTGSTTALVTTADNDGDGANNLQEFATSRNPLASDDVSASTQAQVIGQSSEPRYSTFKFIRPKSATLNVSYQYEVSYDLLTWSASTSEVTQLSVVDVGGNFEEVTIKALTPLGEGVGQAPRIFLRVRIITL